MPDHRSHRGAHPRDAHDFAPEAIPRLLEAVHHFSWLRSRDYAPTSALKLVGDRFALTERQRLTVLRCACSDAALARRRRHEAAAAELRGQPLLIDGFNVLTTLEAALGGAAVLVGRDRCYRDLAGIHGTYRKVEETLPAVQLLGDALAELDAHPCLWLLDSPVSNSGRLRGILLETATRHHWDWDVELVPNPDHPLARSESTVATADSAILDRCLRWFGLARFAIETRVPLPHLVDLSR